jgi:hypothetical protein
MLRDLIEVSLSRDDLLEKENGVFSSFRLRIMLDDHVVSHSNTPISEVPVFTGIFEIIIHIKNKQKAFVTSFT